MEGKSGWFALLSSKLKVFFARLMKHCSSKSQISTSDQSFSCKLFFSSFLFYKELYGTLILRHKHHIKSIPMSTGNHRDLTLVDWSSTMAVSSLSCINSSIKYWFIVTQCEWTWRGQEQADIPRLANPFWISCQSHGKLLEQQTNASTPIDETNYRPDTVSISYMSHQCKEVT